MTICISTAALSPCDRVDIAEGHQLLLACSLESEGGEEAVEVTSLQAINFICHLNYLLLDGVQVVNVHKWAVFGWLRPVFVGEQLLLFRGVMLPGQRQMPWVFLLSCVLVLVLAVCRL